VDDVEEKLHSLLGFYHGYQPSLCPFCELVHGDKQVRVAPGRSFKGSDQIKDPDREWPHDRDRLERLGQQVGLTSIVLTPFVGAHNLLNVGHRGWPVEALSEHISDQGSARGVRAARPPFYPSGPPHRGGNRGKVSSSQL